MLLPEGMVVEKHPWLAVEHADTILMALTSGQAMWAHTFYRNFHDPSYTKFLDMHSQVGAGTNRAFRAACLGQPLDLADANAGMHVCVCVHAPHPTLRWCAPL